MIKIKLHYQLLCLLSSITTAIITYYILCAEDGPKLICVLYPHLSLSACLFKKKKKKQCLYFTKEETEVHNVCLSNTKNQSEFTNI